jgi:uncharacterized protein with GYD domain
MFTYVGLIKLTPEGREQLTKAPEYLEKIRRIVEEEGGTLEETYAIMGPWDFFAIVKYPDNETAFRVLAKIGLLEVVETETFPAEKVDVFLKAFV